MIESKTQAIDRRHPAIVAHKVWSCHGNVLRRFVFCRVAYTHANGTECSGKAVVTKTRSDTGTQYHYRQYGFACKHP